MPKSFPILHQIPSYTYKNGSFLHGFGREFLSPFHVTLELSFLQKHFFKSIWEGTRPHFPQLLKGIFYLNGNFLSWVGQGDDYIYVEQTRFVGLHTHTELQLTDKQQEDLGRPNIQSAFLEYYIIQTAEFHDVIKDTLDEWIYFFKNSEILDSFRAKGMEDVWQNLAVMKMSNNA